MPIFIGCLYLYVKGALETAKIRGADLLVLAVLQNRYGHQKKKEVQTISELEEV